MKVFKLLQVVLSKAEKGLWYDHDQRFYDERGWGLVFKVFAGPIVRPITKPQYWFVAGIPSKWNEFDPQFHYLLKLWLPLCPFISIAAGRFGLYAGFKVFDLESEKYRKMVGSANVHPGSQALTPSITTRTTRWK